MNPVISQPTKIVSWAQVHDLDSLIQFYANCWEYAPDLFLIGGVISIAMGYYTVINREKIQYNLRILIIAVKNGIIKK